MGKGNYIWHVAAVLISGVWGVTYISTKVLIANGLMPQEIFFLRFLIAYIGMWAFSRSRLWADNWQDELWLLLGGVTGGSFYFLTENTALGITLATNVAFIICTVPLITAFLSILFYKQEHLSIGLMVGSLLGLVGVALVLYNGKFVLKISPLGDFLTLLAAFSWAFYSLIMRRLFSRYNTAFITRKVFFYGLLTILPAFLWHPWQFPLSGLSRPMVISNILFLGVMASLVCYVVWNMVLKRLGTVKASNYIYLNPVFTLIGSMVMIGERPTPVALLGAAFALVGVYIAERMKGDKSTLKKCSGFLHFRTRVVHPCFEAMAGFVDALPDRFTRGEGTLMRKERNELRIFEYGDERYVVKSYRCPVLVNRFVYGILRPSKAKRAYKYALRLLEIGISTPQPVGYLNLRRWGLFDRSYFICRLSTCPHTYSDLLEDASGNAEAVCRAVGRVTASLHTQGILHKDYGKGNILFQRLEDGTVKLEIIDLNRMRFGRVSLKTGCKNFDRLPATPQMHRWMADAYALARGFDAAVCYERICAYREKRCRKKGERI